MKALVTGATGFVGGAVARALVNSGIDVRVLAALDQRSHHGAADESGCTSDEGFHLEDVKRET